MRDVLVAHLDGGFVGDVTLNWYPDYDVFEVDGLPEIEDLNVLPAY